jgi:hypothetical protein
LWAEPIDLKLAKGAAAIATHGVAIVALFGSVEAAIAAEKGQS